MPRHDASKLTTCAIVPDIGEFMRSIDIAEKSERRTPWIPIIR